MLLRLCSQMWPPAHVAPAHMAPAHVARFHNQYPGQSGSTQRTQALSGAVPSP